MWVSVSCRFPRFFLSCLPRRASRVSFSLCVGASRLPACPFTSTPGISFRSHRPPACRLSPWLRLYSWGWRMKTIRATAPCMLSCNMPPIWLPAVEAEAEARRAASFRVPSLSTGCGATSISGRAPMLTAPTLLLPTSGAVPLPRPPPSLPRFVGVIWCLSSCNHGRHSGGFQLGRACAFAQVPRASFSLLGLFPTSAAMLN